jgi:hypothetical protein
MSRGDRAIEISQDTDNPASMSGVQFGIVSALVKKSQSAVPETADHAAR